MRCKRHPYELGVGVCASCLRERLLALIAAQNGRSPELRRDLDPPPPPAAFPRSVSPYVGHCRSLGSGPSPLRPHCRFFSTPQVGPAVNSERIDPYRSYSCNNNNSNISSSGSGKKSKKFSLFSALFGIPRSDDVRSSSKSSSWISGLFPGRRKKKPQRQSRSKSFQDRGMSPVRDNDDDDDDNDSACSSGYSTESSTGWRRPEPTPVRKFTSSSSSAARHGRGVSGFAVCLSPLVRPSSKPAADLGISGDLRGALSGHHHNHHHHHQQQHRRHVSAGVGSLGPSRSRKLVDHGRFR